MEESTYYKYAKDVVDGKIVACKWIKLACSRFIRDLSDQRFVFRKEKVDRALKFMGLFKHYSGKFAGKKFELLPWQQFYIANLFGFYWANNQEKRRYQVSYLQISRKSGKTFLSAAICLYAMLGEGEPAAEVLLLATTREQAEIALKMCKQLGKQLDPHEKKIRLLKKSIEHRKSPNYLKVLSSDGSTLDGYGPNLFLIDEYHSHSTSELFDVMISGQGARLNPMGLVITTAGFNLNGPCKEMRDINCEILEGVKQDETQFSMIFELDEEDDWEDDKVWEKAAPNMNVTVNKEFISSQINRAKNNPSEKTPIMTKTLNIWCDSAITWIPTEIINNSMKKLDWEVFRNKTVYVGVDLSSVSDLTAVSFMFEENDKFYWKSMCYLPKASMERQGEIQFYRKCVKNGDLILTDGNVVDYKVISDTIDRLCKEYDITVDSVAYDKYNATQWALDMEDRGYELIEYSQSLSSFNRPTKDFERIAMSNMAVIDENQMTKFCFRNVVLKQDWNGNCKPDKSKNEKKIDITIAMLQCLGGYQVQGNDMPFAFTINE